jgi:hypothetical protein
LHDWFVKDCVRRSIKKLYDRGKKETDSEKKEDGKKMNTEDGKKTNIEDGKKNVPAEVDERHSPRLAYK